MKENKCEGDQLDLGLCEGQIVWLEDISKLDYVRELVVEAVARRTGVPFRKGKHPGGRLVGYSDLFPEAMEPRGKGTGFTRRAWFLKSHDRYYEPGVVGEIYKTGAPLAGVDPRSVKPDWTGLKTPRSENVAPENW